MASDNLSVDDLVARDLGATSPQPAQPAPTTVPAPLSGVDALVSRDLGAQSGATATAIRNNMLTVGAQNPDQAARDQQVARYLNVPPDAVQSDPIFARQQLAARGVDTDSLTQQTPALAQWLTKQSNAAIAHDDVQNLAGVEGAVRNLPAPNTPPPNLDNQPTFTALPDQAPTLRQRLTDWWAGVTGGPTYTQQLQAQNDAEANAILAARASNPDLVPPTNATPQQVNDLNNQAWEQSRQAIGGMSQVPQMFAQNLIQGASFGLVRPAVETPAHSWQASTAGGAGQLAGFLAGPMAAAGKVVGAIPGASALAPAAGEAWASGLAKTVLQQGATMGLAGAMGATGDAALDSSSPGEALSKIGQATETNAAAGAGFGAFSKLLPDSTIAQWLGRTVANSAVQDVTGGTTPWDDRPAADKVFEYGLNALFSAHGAGRTTGGWFANAAPVIDGVADAEKAQQAQAGYQAISALGDAAAASKTRSRDQGNFADLVQSMNEDGKLPEVWVSANDLAGALNQSGVTGEQFAQKLPDVAAQLNEAIPTNGDVRIPVADYAAHIAGSPADAALRPLLKIDPDGMTYQQSQEWQANQEQAMQQQASQVIADSQAKDAETNQSDALRNQILGDIQQGSPFASDTNRAYAELHNRFYQSVAPMIDMTPEAMYEKYGPQIAREYPGAGAFDQAPNEPSVPQQSEPEMGPFGPVLRDYQGDAQGAIAKLQELKTGEAIGALHHPDIGDIDLPYGEAGTGASNGFGVAKLAQYHPEVLEDLQGILSAMHVTSRSDNRVNLESDDHRAGVRLTWNNEAKNWLLTAFRKNEGGGEATRTDTGNLSGTDDTASRADASDAIVDQKIDKFYQGREAGSRGAYSPAANTIALLKNADLSTFLHETGHFFLNTLRTIGDGADAPQAVRDELGKLDSWYAGNKDDIAAEAARHAGGEVTPEQVQDYLRTRTSGDPVRDAAIDRAMHEQFARGFEKYLMEGKAPSIELNSIFSRFASWLKQIYTNLSGLGVQLTPEVRGVFDRMLASDAEIQEAQRVRGYRPLFESAADAGMTPEAFAQYQALGTEARDAAVGDLQGRMLRDMQWLSNTKRRAERSLQRDAAEKRRAVREEVTQQVMAEPIEQARSWLKTGETTDTDGNPVKADKGYKLNTDDLASMYPDGMLARPDLSRLRGMTAKDGLHPDLVAEMFGFPTGDNMVRNLIDGEPAKSKIDGLTDSLMLERHGEIATPQAVERAAEAAIHNEARTRFVATELKALAKAVGPARDLARAAQEAAEAAIAVKRVGDLRPNQYLAAEARAGRAAEAALSKGDRQGAAMETRARLLNGKLFKVAHEAVADVQRIVASQRRYDKASIRAKLDPDILAQIDSLRERFDFRQNPPEGPPKEQVSLQQWANSQKALGYTPLEHPDMMNPAVRKPYRDMTVDEMRGFHATIRSLEHIARERKSIMVEGKRVLLDDTVDDLVGKMQARSEQFSARDIADPPRHGVDPFWQVALHRMASFLRAATAEAKPQQYKANQFDQHEVLGPFTRVIFNRVFDANYRKVDMLKGLSTDFREGANALGKDWQDSLTQLVPNNILPDVDLTKETGQLVYRRLTRGDMLGIARHVGNESNFDKLTKGMQWQPEDVWRFLNANMGDKDWRATQMVWDSFEKFWPDMADMNRRLGNTSPDHIEPRAFTTPSGIDMRGGYSPIDYDPLRSKLAVKKSDASAIDPADGLFGRGYFRADTTTNGSLNARVANYYDRLDLDYHGLERRLHDTIHDLAYREALVDAHKVLSDSRFRRQFQLTYGPEQYRSLQEWVGDLANGQNTDAQMSRLRQLMESTRHMVVANGIALRVSTMLKHGGSALAKSSGYFSGGGEKYFAARAAQMATSHAEMVSGAIDKFSEIRARAMQQDRDYRETTASLFQPEGFQSRAERFGHSAVAFLDLLSAVPTAWAAYDRAITEGIPTNRGGTGQPMNETDARAYANQIVREAHGSNIESARAMLMQNRNEGVKIFTTLYGFMNNSLGQTMDMADKLGTAGFSKPEVLARFMMAAIVPALVAGAVEGKDKTEGWAAWAAWAITGEFAGMVPGLRDAVSMLKGYSNAGLPPLMQTLSAAGKPFRDAWEAANGKAPKQPIKDLGNALGLAVPGLGQISATAQYAHDWATGAQHPQGIGDVARGLLLGQEQH